MEIFANELSVSPNTFDDYKTIRNLIDAYTKLKSKGVTVCRISSEDFMFLSQSFQADINKKNLLYFFYSFFQAPYEGYKNIEIMEDAYYEHEWRYGGKTCFGLAIAHLMDSMSLSFDAETWKEIVNIDCDADQIKVRNVSNGSHVEYYDDWFLSQNKVELLETDISYDDKPIRLRDDHGKEVLMEFAKKICNSPYVTGVVNSMPFNCHEKKFIRQIKENGLVECVLCWTDAGYGLVVQTTGRNRRETERIAEVLREKYAK